MRMMAGAAALAAIGANEAVAVEVATPHVYVSPTLGLLHWDGRTFGNVDVETEYAPLIGLRVGYAPFEAISGEVVVLTASTEADFGAGGPPLAGLDPAARLTLVEWSFVVNFRRIVEANWYPFVNLGAGVALRSSDVGLPANRRFDGSEFAFHLGGGVKVDVHPRASIRLNVRDTFYTVTRELDGQEFQDTLDAVELSAALEYRFPFRAGRGPTRLR